MCPNFITSLSGNRGHDEGKNRALPKKLASTVKFFFYFLLFSAAVIIIFSFNVVFSKNGPQQESSGLFYWNRIKSIVTSQDGGLKGESSDRINILLLGIGGQGHDGPYLTDTIIILSVVPSTGEAAFISVPRDLYVPIPDFGWQKINHAVAFGKTKSDGEGEKLLARVINDIFDIPVHYYIRVDFEAFKKIVDIVGGVDLYVENTIIDYRYPVLGMEDAENYEDRFEGLVIREGQQHLDGELALKYIRTRHALGSEGNDFARARRQQNVLSALKKKLFSLEFILRPQKIVQIMGILKEHISTNLEVGEIVSLAQMAKEIDMSKITNKVLDNGQNGPLYAATSSDGAYILRPRAGNFSELSQIVNDIFKASN